MTTRLPTRDIWRQLAVAVLAFGLAVGVRWGIHFLAGGKLPFLTFFPAVIAATLFGGLVSGVLTTALCAVFAAFLTEPVGQFSLPDSEDLASLALFLLASFLVIGMGELVNRSRDSARLSAATAQQSWRRLNIQNSITRILIDSPTLELAAGGILRAACDSLGWSVGAIWLVDHAQGALCCLEVWSQESAMCPQFKQNTRQRTFKPKEGLPGRVWATAAPAWIPDVVQDDNFPRAPIARQEGLHAALGFPIVLDSEVLGVVEFFSDQIQRPDDELLQTMAALGGQLGQFIKRRRAEFALRDSEALKSSILETSLDGIITIDRHGGIVEFNAAAEKIFGYPRAQAVGQLLADLVIPERFRQQHRGGIAHYLKTGEGPVLNRRLELVALRADGGEFPVEVAITRLPGEGPPLFTGYIRDISEQKRAHHALEEGKERFARFMQHLPGLAWSKDLTGRYVFANEAAQKAFGKSAEELYGRTDREIFPPETAAAFEDNDRKALESDAGIQTLEMLSHGDGQVHYSVVNKFPIPGPDGKPALVGGIAIDITEQKQIEVHLRSARQQLQLVTDTMGAPVTRCSRDHRYLWVSKPYAQWLGLTPEQIIGREIVDVVGGPGYAEILPYIERVLQGEVVEYETQVDFHNVGKRWIHAVYNPTLDPRGMPDGWVAVVSDVTRRHEMEESLLEADRRKDEFLATLAHELRNPLAPLRNGLQVMRLAKDDPRVVEEVGDMMERQLRQMVRLIDDLLDVSRISQGKLELRRQRINLASVVTSAVETSRPLIESAGHHFAVSTPAEPIFVDADETRLAQVIANLLNNAVKFTPRGGHIKLAVMRDGPDVAISVVDDGIGIPADMLPRVFDMFTQVDQSLEKSHGGLGIGLTIAKRLIELHHGCIEVHSPAPAKGTEFIIRLPVAMSVVSEVDRAIDAGDSSRPARGRRILVVDDNRDAAHSLALMLGLMGADTRVAHDGLSALEVAENYRPDTVLLDLGMPKLNGYETCAQLRQQPWAKGILLVAITGWGNEDNRRRSREAGFDYHLVKPVDLRTLRQVLDSREEEESGRISGNSAAPE